LVDSQCLQEYYKDDDDAGNRNPSLDADAYTGNKWDAHII